MSKLKFPAHSPWSASDSRVRTTPMPGCHLMSEHRVYIVATDAAISWLLPDKEKDL